MRIIGKRFLIERTKANPDAKNAIATWLKIAKAAQWRSLNDIRKDLSATDTLGPLAIFNIRGNRYRLIARIEFEAQRLYIKEFLTHAQYDKEQWKKWL